MVLLWIYLLVFLIRDKHASSSGLIVFALICNVLLNILWFLYYKKKIISQDAYYINYS